MENEMYFQVHRELKKTNSFDSRSFEQLTEDTDPGVTLKILAYFSMTLREALVHIQEGLEKRDANMVWQACHKVAGSAELVGFKHFGANSKALNVTIRALKDLQAHDAQLEKYLEDGQRVLKEIEVAFPKLKDYL